MQAWAPREHPWVVGDGARGQMWAGPLRTSTHATSLLIQLAWDGPEDPHASSQGLRPGSRSGQCHLPSTAVRPFLSTRHATAFPFHAR